jgi:hypothetical protein
MFASPLRRRGNDELLPLDEAMRRLRPFERFHLGVRPVPVRQIVGTDGRAADFDRRFVPRQRESLVRRRALERAFPTGDFPPVVVHRLGDAYFVLDGHHRVSIAREREMETLDADVTVVRARWELDADSGLLDLVHAEQEWIFMHESGLVHARPGARIRLSLAVGYSELLESVHGHGYRLMRDAGALLAPRVVAADWHDRVYLPTTEAIRRGRLDGFCRGATDADRFLHVQQIWRELRLECSRTPLEEAVRRATSP